MLLSLLPVFFAAATPGCADLPATDGELAPLELKRRSIALTVEDGAGVAHVRDRLVPEIRGAATTGYAIDLPHDRGVVVDAWLTTRNGRIASKLVEPDVAETTIADFRRALRHGSLMGEDGEAPVSHGPPQAMLVVAHQPDAVWVSVASPCGLGPVTVHVRVALASDPVDDGWMFHLPSTEGVTPARVQVPGSFFHVREDGGLLVERTRDGVRGRVALASLPGDAGFDEVHREDPRHVLRAELDLPRRLEPEQPLAVVFIVDRSISFGRSRAAGTARLMARYLDDAPAGSAFAVVTMARHPEVVVAPWTDAGDVGKRAIAEVAAARLTNGSDLVRALERARSIAADAGDREPRVVVLSDFELSNRVDDADVLAATAGRRAPITHFVRVWGEGTLDWDRSFPWEDDTAHAPAATGGVLVKASVVEEKADAGLAAYLLRPTRLELPRLLGLRAQEVAIDSYGQEPEVAVDGRRPQLVVESETSDETADESLPEWVDEGGGLRVTGITAPAVDAEALRWSVGGWLWGTQVRYPLRATPATARLLPAIAAVNDLADALTDSDVSKLAHESGAVTRVTSRLADAGWRPPVTDMLYGWGCGCGGCGGSRGASSTCISCRSGCAHGPNSRVEQLTRRLERARDVCGPSAHTLVVEHGDQEVLRVDAIGGYASTERCYIEVVWGLRLAEEEGFIASEWAGHGETTVRLPHDEPADDEPADDPDLH